VVATTTIPSFEVQLGWEMDAAENVKGEKTLIF
jgi:hypothetical protein